MLETIKILVISIDKAEDFELFLSVHLDDTMNIATLLWEHWLSRRQRNFILSSMRETNKKEGADVQKPRRAPSWEPRR